MEIYSLSGRVSAKPLNPNSIVPNGNFFGEGDESLLIFLTLDRFSAIKDGLHYPPKAVQDVLDSNQVPNIEFYEDLLFITLNNIMSSEEAGEEALSAGEINLFLGKNRLLVVYHGPFAELEHARKRLDHSSITTALYSFIDALLDNNKRLITKISQDAEDLEDQILETVQVDDNRRKKSRQPFHDPDRYMSRIVSLRKSMQLLKAYIEPTQDVIEILEYETGLIDEENGKYFQKLSLKADRLVDYLNNLRDTIAEVRASWQSQVDLTFNKVAKLFTVITAVFSPLTLIVGWFGMNFLEMPGLNHPLGYPTVAALSFIVFVASMWWFKKNHYI